MLTEPRARQSKAEVTAMAQAIEKAIRRSGSGKAPVATIATRLTPSRWARRISGTAFGDNKPPLRQSGDTVTAITVKPDDGFKLDELAVIDKNGK